MKIAIYSRQSKISDVGDSIENQISLCKEYAEKILNYNEKDFLIYEDEGFSGGNSNRPAFKKMMSDINKKKFNILLCYRLDRISRNVADFSKTLDILNENNISFISIKEQFDTSTPMGKAMMYIASVFAQLERDTIAERVKDNIRELAKTGRYLGGNTPFGFKRTTFNFTDEKGNKKKLSAFVIIPEEAEIINLFYTKYLELGSLRKLVAYTHQNNLRTKKGVSYQIHSLRNILINPVYVKSNTDVYNYLKEKGYKIISEKENFNGCGLFKNFSYEKNINDQLITPAKHKGIVEADIWISVQEKLFDNRNKNNKKIRNNSAVLSGLLKCKNCGSNMRPRNNRINKKGETVFYYTCELKEKSRGYSCKNKNINGSELDKLLINEIYELSCGNKIVIKKDSNKSELIKELEEELKKNKISVKNLISNLEKSQSADSAKLIFERISELENNNNRIEKKLSELKDISDTMFYYNNFANLLTNFKNDMLTSNTNDKRKYMKSLLSEITWDGEKIEYTLSSINRCFL